MMKNSTIKVLIVDDHIIVLDGLRNLIHDEGNIVVVDRASNGIEALYKIENLQVDVVITDINMPKMDGIELTNIIKREYPNIKVLILTVHNEKEILKKALATGAEACLMKNTTKKELIQAITDIQDDGYYYCEDIYEISKSIFNTSSYQPKPIAQITQREHDILYLLLKGKSNKQIAKELIISYHTVCTHRKNLMKKAGCHNIADLFAFARANDFIG